MGKCSFRFQILLMLNLLALLIIHTQQKSVGRGNQVHGRNNIVPERDGTISRSQSTMLEQKRRFKQLQSTVSSQTQFKSFLFTVTGMQQFLLNLPVAQQVSISIFTYVKVDNAYMRSKSVDNQPPIKLYIYQNNNRIIHQSDFFFESYIVFQGLQLSTYTLRFMNSGPEKLVAMNVKRLTQSFHVEQIVDKKIAEQYSVRTNSLSQQLKFLMNTFQRSTMINLQCIKALLSNISLYYHWQIFQTIVAVIVCIIQVIVIKRTCKQSSIV